MILIFYSFENMPTDFFNTSMTSSFSASCLRSERISASSSRWRLSLRFCLSVAPGWKLEPWFEGFNANTKLGGNFFWWAALFSNHFDCATLECFVITRWHCSFFDWHKNSSCDFEFVCVHFIISHFFLSIKSGKTALIKVTSRSGNSSSVEGQR